MSLRIILFLCLWMPVCAEDPRLALLSEPDGDVRKAVAAARSLVKDPGSISNVRLQTALVLRAEGLRPEKAPRTTEHAIIRKDHAHFELMLLLAQVDARGNQARLKVSMDLAMQRLKQLKYMSWESQRYRLYAAELGMALYPLDEGRALAGFCSVLGQENPTNMQIVLRPVLRALVSQPEDDVIAAFADELFNGKESPWNPLLNLETGYHAGANTRTAYREHALVVHPAFQKQLGRMLANRTLIGTATILDEESVAIAIDKGWTDSITRETWRGTLPAAGGTHRFRVCDYHAFLLQEHEEYPAFELFWPEPNRNAALAKILKTFPEGT